MFSRLLKHEFKSQCGIFSVLSLAALGAGLLGGGMMALLMHLTESNSENVSSVMGIATAGMLLVGVCLALVAYAVAVELLLIYRFYKHLFSDEGYLTFTLPVTTHQILLSSIVNITIWTLISGLVTLLGILMIVAPMFTMSGNDVGTSLVQDWQLIRSEFGGELVVLQIISTIAKAIYSLILPLLSITIGALIAKKHKVLAAFGIYFGINMVISTLSGVVSILTAFSDFMISYSSNDVFYVFSTLVPALVYLGLGIGGYFIMHHLVDKKLNLA